MPHEFCEHLGVYSHNWVRAEAAHKAMGAAAERLITEGPTDDCLDLMEVTLRDWQFEVKQLRERFAALVKRGVVELPETDAAEDDAEPADACCATCGFVVPRLSWPDWARTESGRPSFRGNELSQGTSVSPVHSG